MRSDKMGGVRRMIGIGLAATAMVAAASLMPALPASAAPASGPAANGTYLALGDSVAFGYVPPEAVPAPNYRSANSFVGYPEDLGKALRLGVWNASCPGETTASMFVPGAQSNGCENSLGSSTGYRTQFPLHVQYKGTQMEYALKYLAVHRHTQLVTIDIGANDAFLEEALCKNDPTCILDGFPALLNEIGTNLATMYQEIRDVAHYQGLLVALTYYSTNYNDQTTVNLVTAINNVITSVTEAFGGEVADGFAAFKVGSGTSGDPCAAGLLIKLPDGTCNIHPSPAGHLLLAQAIENVLGVLPPK
jgi:lysophospholipase L1-like esterase